jgi:predicted ribosomally synthesized peptide with nif11-like leader
MATGLAIHEGDKQMPTEGASAFVQSVQRDEDLQKKLGAIEAETKEAMLKEVARIAEEAGFILTSEEVAATVKEESEVTDAQLDHVVGGLTRPAPLSSTPTPVAPTPDGDTGGVVAGHTYTVCGTINIDGDTYVVLRNPWGVG